MMRCQCIVETNTAIIIPKDQEVYDNIQDICQMLIQEILKYLNPS